VATDSSGASPLAHPYLSHSSPRIDGGLTGASLPPAPLPARRQLWGTPRSEGEGEGTRRGPCGSGVGQGHAWWAQWVWRAGTTDAGEKKIMFCDFYGSTHVLSSTNLTGGSGVAGSNWMRNV
jgi:hypothetical protein